jgi:hypothetical protein
LLLTVWSLVGRHLCFLLDILTSRQPCPSFVHVTSEGYSYTNTFAIHGLHLIILLLYITISLNMPPVFKFLFSGYYHYVSPIISPVFSEVSTACPVYLYRDSTRHPFKLVIIPAGSNGSLTPHPSSRQSRAPLPLPRPHHSTPRRSQFLAPLSVPSPPLSDSTSCQPLAAPHPPPPL